MKLLSYLLRYLVTPLSSSVELEGSSDIWPPGWRVVNQWVWPINAELQPATGGLSDKLHLKLNMSKDVAAFTVWGTLFHSFGPWAAKDLSYSDWLRKELEFGNEGIIATSPCLGVTLNLISQQFGSTLWRIFNIIRMIHLSRLCCRDINLSCTSLSQ